MKKTFACVVMVLMVLFLAGIVLDHAVPKASAAEPKQGGRVVFYYGWDPGHFDHQMLQSYKTQYYTSWTNAKLTTSKMGGDVGSYEFIVVPDLAIKWEHLSPTEIVYTLRKGAKWQNRPPMNAREITADDIKYSFDRIFKIKSPNRTKFDVIKSIEVLDRYRVKFTLKAPFAPFIKYMSTTYAAIVPKEVVEKFGDLKKWEAAIGAGPWIIKEYKRNEYITYVRNPDYYDKDKPYLDEVHCPIINQLEVRTAAFRTKQIDIVGYWDYDQVKAFQKKNPEVKIHEYYSNSYFRFIFACDRPPFNDKRVRQAASMCIDRQKLTDAVFGGLGVFEGYVARSCWGHLPPDKLGEGKKYFYPDVEAAKKLVKAAGYKLPVNITLEYTNAYTASYRAGGEALIGMLDASGVFKVKPVIKEYGAYIKSTFVGKYSGDCGYILTTPPIEADGFLWNRFCIRLFKW
ncbi:ABC transporter substrate-binding protein [Thermodesulfobacteriota bacterium]